MHVRLCLGRLSGEALGVQLNESELSLIVERALADLTERIESGGWVPPVPSFLVAEGCAAGSVEVELEPGPALRAEAGRQGVPLRSLAVHAVLLAIAARDREEERRAEETGHGRS